MSRSVCHIWYTGQNCSGLTFYYTKIKQAIRTLNDIFVLYTILNSTHYPASRGFSLVFLSVVLPFSSLFWLLAFCFGCFCAEEKTSADSRLGFLLSMRIRYLQDLGGNPMTKLVVEPVLSTRSSFMY